MTGRRYWYRRYIGECPVCGRDASYRLRVYGRKPRLVAQRIIYLPETETFDGCIYEKGVG